MTPKDAPGGNNVEQDDPDIEVAAQQWAQRWIEAHMDKLWDPWGQDLHHELAREVLRQMRWARHSHRWASPETMVWDNGMDPTADVSMCPDHWSEKWEPDRG